MIIKQNLPQAGPKNENKMIHTHSRIWIHLIWTVKKRQRILTKDIGKELFSFLIQKASENKIRFEKLNIQPEHVHGLIDLPTNKTMSDFMHLIKGSSSRMLNKHFFNSKFSWQRGYGAYSVSASKLDIISNYILNQEQHHRLNSFEEEYQIWKKEYGFFDD
ncbi:MAG: IS200/IS605 family transposase [Bacteroidota bacterium]|nr:IS200/IS605 family transposase [Bacteroidota bacterium]